MSEHIIWNEIGTLHFNAGAYAQATKAYQRAIELGDDFSIAIQNLALTYVQDGELTKAIPIYKKALELISQDEEKAALWHQLGEIYAQLRDHENALQAYEMVAEMEKNQDEALEVIVYEQDSSSKSSPISVFDISPKEAKIFKSLNTEELNDEDKDPFPSVDEELAPVISMDSKPTEGGLFHINIEQISANPVQPRLHVNVYRLVESIRKYGIIQPLIVTPSDQPDRYILVSGERRLEAARQVGLDTVPAIIREIDARQRLELALVENVQRQNLSLLEQAVSYDHLKREFGLSPDQIAKQMGKSSIAVDNLLRLLELPEKIRRALDAGRIEEEHARALFPLPNQKMQKKVLQCILDEDLSVRKTEGLVRELLLQVQVSKENNNQSEIEENKPVLAHQIIKLDSATLAEDAEYVEESVAAIEAVTLTSISNDEGLDGGHVVDSVEKKEIISVDEDQQQLEDILVEDDILELAVEDLHQDQDTVDVLPLPSILSQIADFDSPEELLTDEQRRSRIIIFKRVTDVNPQNDKAWGKLGEYYFKLGEEENAIDAYSRAIDLTPNVPDYHHELGQIYISLRYFDDATKELEKVIALNDKNVIVHCMLASSYRHMGMEEKAQEHIDIVAPVIEFEKIYNRACFEAIRGNVTRSAELLRTALRQEQATIEQIQNDADFDFVRAEPVFTKMMTETSPTHNQEVFLSMELSERDF